MDLWWVPPLAAVGVGLAVVFGAARVVARLEDSASGPGPLPSRRSRILPVVLGALVTLAAGVLVGRSFPGGTPALDTSRPITSANAAGTADPTPYQSLGPPGPEPGSRFWARLLALPDALPRAIIASINGTPAGPRCPTDWEIAASDYSDAGGEWRAAQLRISCEDPADGAALQRAWLAGIDTELRRLGALIDNTWSGELHYRLDGYLGQIWVTVLPAPGGRYWVVLRLAEGS